MMSYMILVNILNKKRLVQINSVCNGSTGKIMGEIQRRANEYGYETLSIYGRRKPFKDLNCKKNGSGISTILHGGLTLLFNNHGMYSYFNTKKLVRRLREFKPDIIQLHNIHGYYLNYKLLFKYLKNEFKGKVFWTLHDCWAFTGHCPYFSNIKCTKWQTQCHDCPQIRIYPKSLIFDTSKKEYERKKECFNGIKNLTLITPSIWLSNIVKESFLKYPVKVINNGIDLSIYKPTIDNKIKEKYHIPNNKILGVSSIWIKIKGIDIFMNLQKDIPENTIIVMVGLTKKQIAKLPSNIIGIERTDSQEELVKLYSAADVFANPTLEDNYPTVNLEAIACGTPVVTYNTGGCKEQIYKNTGFVCNSYDEFLSKIKYCIDNDYKNKTFSNKECLDKFNAKSKYDEYMKLYNGDKL